MHVHVGAGIKIHYSPEQLQRNQLKGSQICMSFESLSLLIFHLFLLLFNCSPRIKRWIDRLNYSTAIILQLLILWSLILHRKFVVVIDDMKKVTNINSTPAMKINSLFNIRFLFKSDPEKKLKNFLFQHVQRQQHHTPLGTMPDSKRQQFKRASSFCMFQFRCRFYLFRPRKIW